MKHLQHLLHPISLDEFQNNVFEKKHLHIKRGDSNYYREYLTEEVISDFISSKQINTKGVRLVKLIDDSVEPVKLNAEGKLTVDSRLITKYFLEGYTLVLNALHKQIPSLWDFSNAMTNYFGSEFQTNIYITPGEENQGFNIHHDSHDVFIMQIDGVKHWKFYESPIKLASPDINFDSSVHFPGKLIDEITMHPGDFLYVPRGLMHCANTISEKSIHITGGLLTKTVKEVLIERISAAALEDHRLRKTFNPKYWENGIDAIHLEEIKGILLGIGSKESINQGLINLREFNINSMIPRSESVLKESYNYKQLNLDSDIRKLPEIPFNVEYTEETLTIKLYYQSVELPIDFKPLIEFIIDNHSFKIKELPNILENEDKIDFIRSLIEEGFLTSQ